MIIRPINLLTVKILSDDYLYSCVNELRKYNRHPLCRGVVPIGRTAVSKTDGWEFESLRPCQFLQVNKV